MQDKVTTLNSVRDTAHIVKPGLHIRARGESNSEINDEHPDYILTLWCAWSFVGLTLEAVFLIQVKGCTNVFANQNDIDGVA